MIILRKNKCSAPSGTRKSLLPTCTHVRSWLLKVTAGHLSPQAEWVQNHTSVCPRCQRRLAAFGKVNLALSIIKSQPHKLDLLMQANSQAIGFLQNRIREAPKAVRLKSAVPQPKLVEKCAFYKYSAANIAACAAILILTKVGVFSSIERFQQRGQKLVQQYYTAQIGQDLADEVFRS